MKKKPYERVSNIEGRRFGKLVVEKRVGRDEDRNATWLCKCDCGGEKIVAGKYLKRGNNKSCGCLHTHPEGVAIFSMWFKLYKIGAANRNLVFELNEETFAHLISKNCTYCSKPPSLRTHLKLNGGIIMNGIDRVDSDQGYTLANTVPCCKFCNVMKSNLSLETFKNHVSNMYKTLFSK